MKWTPNPPTLTDYKNGLTLWWYKEGYETDIVSLFEEDGRLRVSFVFRGGMACDLESLDGKWGSEPIVEPED